jgi:CDGSH-type Zn-finger protein
MTEKTSVTDQRQPVVGDVKVVLTVSIQQVEDTVSQFALCECGTSDHASP